MLVWWGKSQNKELESIADFYNCPNCKNYSIFLKLNMVRKRTIYFFTVAKSNIAEFLACIICEASYELPNNVVPLVPVTGIKSINGDFYSPDKFIDYTFSIEKEFIAKYNEFLKKISDDSDPKLFLKKVVGLNYKGPSIYDDVIESLKHKEIFSEEINVKILLYSFERFKKLIKNIT